MQPLHTQQSCNLTIKLLHPQHLDRIWNLYAKKIMQPLQKKIHATSPQKKIEQPPEKINHAT